ncbi:hypothetical protein MMC18_005812 [Xylographa bjoerkii]|nr:hypothetical protein [Xylographa bjoerkii]
MRFYALAALVLPLASAQTPFPIAGSLIPVTMTATLIAQESSYASSVAAQPSYTSFANSICSATVDEAAATFFAEASCDPFNLANAFFTATATPAWYTQLPSNVQSYVSSLANAEATIVQHVMSGGERAAGTVQTMGAALVAGFVGMLFL